VVQIVFIEINTAKSASRRTSLV